LLRSLLNAVIEHGIAIKVGDGLFVGAYVNGVFHSDEEGEPEGPPNDVG